MEGVNPQSVHFALSKIQDGFVFEEFASNFLGKVLGYQFLPAGGIKDRGIDGLEHIYHRDGFERTIYQMSIEKDCVGKLKDTLQKLKNNGIRFEKLSYVTNQVFPNKDIVIDELYETYKKPVQIYDAKWLAQHVNDSQATVVAYETFVSSYLHEFSQPGRSYQISDLVHDPRLFVFLRQQWEEKRDDLQLDAIVADTLILYCLEGTDPDKGIFLTASQIKENVADLVKYDPQKIYGTIDERLTVLTKKPRRITYHSRAAAYCLPYETRLEIQRRNLNDLSIYEEFKKTVEERLRSRLRDVGIKIADCVSLIEATVNRLFYQQGLEFADFVLHGENQNAFEKELPEVISHVVDESSTIAKNRQQIKSALLVTIRDVVYNGTPAQKLYLQRLSSTYMMLFLLQCDPRLAIYFGSMASKLKVFVCTSVIIPALSEAFLDPINQRHANLLKGAHRAGVNLIVNETIIRELVWHFKTIVAAYESKYRDREHLYLGDEMQVLYVDEIMIRAYLYAKMRKLSTSFDRFIDHFVTPDLRHPEEELISFLKSEFGIEYQTDKSLGVAINADEEDRLFRALKLRKSSDAKARADTRLILSVYALREMNNEAGRSGIFGYTTWWLSKDTMTQRTVNEVFRDKYRVSCYIRPDFLYNYITLAPSRVDVEAAYQELFPSLIGINIGYHLPHEVTSTVQSWISEHHATSPGRVEAILSRLSNQLKSDPNYRTRKSVRHYLDEQLKMYEHGECQ